MDIRNLIKSKRLYVDGGMGTLLQKRGLQPGELPELWNLSHPEIITSIHSDYLSAGADILTTNTFGANKLKFDNLSEIIFAAIENARRAIEQSGMENKFVAFDVGPLGQMLEPIGSLKFEEAVSVFACSISIAQKAGADLILIETMNDLYEQKAAVLAAKEASSLPVFATNAFDENGRLMTGAEPKAVIAMLEGLNVDALGVNCSLGPKQLQPIVDEYLKYSSLPVIVSPNAGMPKSVDGKTVYDIDADEFAKYMKTFAENGVCILGGCCGTTPEFIKKTKEQTSALPYSFPKQKPYTIITSYTNAVLFEDAPVLIGERINPTGKKKFKQALIDGDIDYIVKEGAGQQEAGAHALDVNVGLPEIDEKAVLKQSVQRLQAVVDIPLQIDTSDASAMEAALRIYNGKALINSVNGKQKVMEEIFPLAKKYGGVVIGLTIDENGIPQTADGRFEIAKKIVAAAESYGISKKDIIIDPLAMAVSSDSSSGMVTLEAIKRIKTELGVGVSLGVSNISFGLPNRDLINSTFFTMAMQNGLSAAIINPYSSSMMSAYHSYLALCGIDNACLEYIDFVSKSDLKLVSSQKVTQSTESQGSQHPLIDSISRGLKKEAVGIVKTLLQSEEPLNIINSYIVPALDIAGLQFEKKQIFLPQLLMCAEAASCVFEEIKPLISTSGSSKPSIILATVKGDVHDIGKNIVKVLLQSYGYDIIDLGKDVEPQAIVDAAQKTGVELVGLSALMTTTVGAMEETITLLHKNLPNVKVIVGGAVLTKSYAEEIGADFYAKDAMESVKYAEEVFEKYKK